MKKRLLAPALAIVAITACDALTSHVDTVARAGSQELTAARLAELMSGGTIPARKDVALAIANIWVNYHLLAYAAAHGDSLNDNRTIDDAMWAQIAQRRSQKFNEALGKTFPAAGAAEAEKAFNAGALLAAQHILISADRNTLKADQIESARQKAIGIRKQTTSENFAAMAKKYSGDPGSKETGGEYVFPRGQMVPEFEQGTMALKPGEISAPVQSQFGFHIIRRETYAEAKAKFDPMFQQLARSAAESTFLVRLVDNAKVEVKPGAGKLVKDMVQDIDRYRDDRTVLATSRKVDLRLGRVAHWIAAMPPQMRARQQIEQSHDTVVAGLVKNLMQNELILKAADSANINVDTTELSAIRSSFRGSLGNSMAGLNILPNHLADSAKTVAEREKLAARRVDEFLDKLLKSQVQFVDVSEPVSIALRRKYAPRVIPAGVDRAVTQIAATKAKADSAKDSTLPKSVVPMPGEKAPTAPEPKAAATPDPKAPAKAEPTKKP